MSSLGLPRQVHSGFMLEAFWGILITTTWNHKILSIHHHLEFNCNVDSIHFFFLKWPGTWSSFRSTPLGYAYSTSQGALGHTSRCDSPFCLLTHTHKSRWIWNEGTLRSQSVIYLSTVMMFVWNFTVYLNLKAYEIHLRCLLWNAKRSGGS